MAFEVSDFFRSYKKRGDLHSLFNVAREDTTLDVLQYFAYQNDEGAYIIQRTTTSGSLTVLAYNYYASNKLDSFETDWGNRASLAYGEYHALFIKNL